MGCLGPLDGQATGQARVLLGTGSEWHVTHANRIPALLLDAKRVAFLPGQALARWSTPLLIRHSRLPGDLADGASSCVEPSIFLRSRLQFIAAL